MKSLSIFFVGLSYIFFYTNILKGIHQDLITLILSCHKDFSSSTFSIQLMFVDDMESEERLVSVRVRLKVQYS